jgi:putative ABC transport system permease protein
LFSLGTDFAYDGNVVTSDVNFRRLFDVPSSSRGILDRVDLGLVRLESGRSAPEVRDALAARLSGDVKVQTKAEFERQELEFWRASTPIGYVFKLGALMGFLVGVIICYQILYSDIHDHLAEFATLKAMGYTRTYFVGVVIQEALLLSLVGFVPGVGASAVLYAWLADRTGLPLNLTWPLAGLVLGMTVAMCVGSGCLSLRKLLAADPAELFR